MVKILAKNAKLVGSGSKGVTDMKDDTPGGNLHRQSGLDANGSLWQTILEFPWDTIISHGSPCLRQRRLRGLRGFRRHRKVVIRRVRYVEYRDDVALFII
jgi:hypothetical protein